MTRAAARRPTEGSRVLALPVPVLPVLRAVICFCWLGVTAALVV